MIGVGTLLPFQRHRMKKGMNQAAVHSLPAERPQTLPRITAVLEN